MCPSIWVSFFIIKSLHSFCLCHCLAVGLWDLVWMLFLDLLEVENLREYHFSFQKYRSINHCIIILLQYKSINQYVIEQTVIQAVQVSIAFAVNSHLTCLTAGGLCFGSWAFSLLHHCFLFCSYWYAFILVSFSKVFFSLNCASSCRCVTRGLHLVVNALYSWRRLLIIVLFTWLDAVTHRTNSAL